MPVRYLLLLVSFLLCRGVIYAACTAPSPLYIQTITHQSATLSWSYYGNSSPSFELQWRQAGTATWTINPVTTSYTSSLTGLSNNTAYEWRVRSICAAGDTSTFTNGSIFQTTCAPVTYLDVTNVTHQSAQLIWNQFYGQFSSGTTYEVQWRAAGAPNWTIVSGLTTNSLNLVNLSEDTSFEWKIRRICSSTATSDFSTGPYFRTRCLTPSNPRTTQTSPGAVELKWDSPVANTRFDLQWRQAGQSNWTLVEGIQAPEYVLTGLLNATTYEWQVRTACSSTSKSVFTDIKLFQSSCPLPSNLSTSSVTYNSALLQWTSPTSDLQWRPAGATDWNTIPGARPPYTLTGLANNTVYEWRVRTVCSPAVASDYTASQLLTTRCSTPSGVYGNVLGPQTIRVFWDRSGSNTYELQWRIAGTTNWAVVSGLTTSPYSLTGLSPGTAYEWRFRSQCSATEYSDFIVSQLTTSTCGPPSTFQYENATNTSIDLIWNSSDPGVTFDVQYRPANSANWSSISDIRGSRYTLTGLQTNIPYEWRIRVKCSATLVSDYSSIQSFTLSCLQPSYFYSGNIDATSAAVMWYGVSYPPYTIQYRPAGTTDWVSVENITASSYTFNGLTPNQTYEWRVRSACSLGSTTDFGATQTFQTQCGSLPWSLAAVGTSVNSVRLTWQNSNNTKRYEIQYRETGSLNWTVLQPEGKETDSNYRESSWSYEKGYSLYNLTPGKTYEWRIRVMCSPSFYLDFVNGPTFTTACPIPQNVYGRQETNTSLTVGWYTAGLSAICDLQWRKVGSQTWNTINGLTNNSYLLTNLDPGSSYEVRVRQVCLSDVVSDFSTPVRVSLPCIIPNAGGTQTLSATSVKLQWGYNNQPNPNVPNEIRSYDVQYRLSGTSAWTMVSGISSTSYSLTGLTSGNSYEWRVRASCSQEASSDFSLIYSFQLSCPVLNYLGYTMLGNTFARLTWSDYTGLAKSYTFQWRVAGTAEWTTVSVSYSDYTTTYLLTGLTNNTAYEWRVATNCGGDYLSDFSAVQSFQTACASVQYLYVNSVAKNSAQIRWEGTLLPQDAVYTVQYRISGTAEWASISGLTSTSTTITGLLENTTYEWRVRAECDSGAPFSSTSTFTTQCPNPTNPHTEAVKAESAIIAWTKQAENVFVNLQWRSYNDTNGWNTVEGLTGSTYSLTGLTAGSYYEYRLQGVCSVDRKELYTMPSTYFSTPPTTVYFNINADSVAADAARLSWTNGPDRTDYILQWRVQNGNWNTTGPLSSKRYLLTGLLNNTTYEVRLSYVQQNGTTYQTTTSFTTSCNQPYLYPYTTDIRSTSARLTWSSGRLPVLIQWRVAGTAAWNLVAGITGNSYSLTGLATGALYEWRLLTQCSAGDTLASYSSVFRTICPMPSLTYTANVTTQSAQLIWNNTSSLYSLKYRMVGATDWTILTGLTSNTYVLTNLTDNTTYEWAVATNCEGNTITAYTSPLQFKTRCISATSFGISTTQGPDFVQLYWEGSGPDFQFQWRAVGSTTWNTIPAVTPPYRLTGLTPGITYEYQVRAACVAAVDGPFTAGPNFSTNCYYTTESMTTDVTSTNARLNWVTNAAGVYGLRWRAVGDSNWTVVTGNLTAPYTLTGLANNTDYEWQLRTPCQPNYSPSQVFHLQCNSPITLKTEGLAATSVMLKWNPSSENVGYKIRWRRVGTTTWNTIPAITATSYSLTGLTNNISYEWQVASQCSNDETNYQITASFKTSTDCPSGMYTLKNGSWDDPTVWSCNRVPTAGDQVQLKHVLTVPNGYTAKALTIAYQITAQLNFGLGATIQLSQ